MKIVIISCFLAFCIFAAAHGKIRSMHYIIFAKRSQAKTANAVNFLNGNKGAMNNDSLSFLVSVRRDNKHICQGSILTSSVVMVPKHCVECGSESELNSLEVLAGTNNLKNTSSGVLYNVSDISCNKLDPKNNIVLLTLSNNITTNQRTIYLAARNENDNVTSKKTSKKFIVGWNIKEGKNSSEIENLPVPTFSTLCTKIFKELSLTPSNYLCTKKAKYDVCEGNSDHVMIADDQIIGIPTKIGCDKKIRFNIFTRVESLTE